MGMRGDKSGKAAGESGSGAKGPAAGAGKPPAPSGAAKPAAPSAQPALPAAAGAKSPVAKPPVDAVKATPAPAPPAAAAATGKPAGGGPSMSGGKATSSVPAAAASTPAAAAPVPASPAATDPVKPSRSPAAAAVPAAAAPAGSAGSFAGTGGRASFAPAGPPAGSGAGRLGSKPTPPPSATPFSSAPSWSKPYVPTSPSVATAAAMDAGRRAAEALRAEQVSGIPAAAAGGAMTSQVVPPTSGGGASAGGSGQAMTPAARADAERAAMAGGKAPPPPRPVAETPAIPPAAAPSSAAAPSAPAAGGPVGRAEPSAPAEGFVAPSRTPAPAPPAPPPSASAPAASAPNATPPAAGSGDPAAAGGTDGVGLGTDPTGQPPLLFEIAWEVCWQLGGIYTVLRSKAQAMIHRWGDRYCLVGPYNPATAPVEFEEQPTYGPIREAMNRLKEQGIPSYFGRWLIAGRPRVLLIDYRAKLSQLGTDKFLMWQDHQIELPADDGEVNEVVAFGFAATEFFRHLGHIVKDRPVIAHFHEWMGGVAVPRMAHLKIPIATVFTTHATLLGRYLAGDNPYFYDHLQFVDPDKEAAKYQIYPRFALERAAAHAATVFTTVSDVTGVEAEKLLGRAPDLITPNGINLHKFAAPHEFQHLHAKYKEKINDFVKGHFFPSYSFDLDRTLYVFTSGRYEYRNKGMDMFIEAMHRLNWRLKGIPNPPTVVGFIITRAATKNINVRVLQNQSMYEDLRHTCQDVQQQMGNRLLSHVVRGSLPGSNDLLLEDEQVRLKRAMHAWRSPHQPLIVTHDLVDDAGDPILRHLRHRQMFNAKDDPVKMVFHPDFLSAVNPVMAMDYEQFVRGTHMGIFPSYYEPWGYTPLECVALGVPTVTTDLAGFGSYAQKHVYARERRDADRQGIQIVHRRNRSFDDACETLVNHLFTFCQYNRRQRIEMRNRTERLGEQFDWSTLSRHYDDAHGLALSRTGSNRRGHLEVRVV